MISRRRGQAGIIGAILIAFMIMASIATYMFLSSQTSGYVDVVNRAIDRRESKIDERLEVIGYPDRKMLEIKNIGDVPSHIVAFVLLNNETGEMKFYPYDLKLNMLDEVNAYFNEMLSYPPWISGVLTEFGNIFWDEVATGGGNGGGGNNGEFGISGSSVEGDISIIGNPFNTTYLYIREGTTVHVLNTKTMQVVRDIVNVIYYDNFVPTYDNRYIYFIYWSGFAGDLYIFVYDLSLGDFIGRMIVDVGAGYRPESVQLSTAGDRLVIACTYRDDPTHVRGVIAVITPDLKKYFIDMINVGTHYGYSSYGYIHIRLYQFDPRNVYVTFDGAHLEYESPTITMIFSTISGRQRASITYVVPDNSKVFIIEDKSSVYSFWKAGNTYYGIRYTEFLYLDKQAMKAYIAKRTVTTEWYDSIRETWYQIKQLTYDRGGNNYLIYNYGGLMPIPSPMPSSAFPNSTYVIPYKDRFLVVQKSYYHSGWVISYAYPVKNYIEIYSGSLSGSWMTYTLLKNVTTSGKYPRASTGLSTLLPAPRGIISPTSPFSWFSATENCFIVVESGYVEMFDWSGNLLNKISMQDYIIYDNSGWVFFDANTYTIFILVKKDVGVSLIKVEPG